jgi:hypothetical protein
VAVEKLASGKFAKNAMRQDALYDFLCSVIPFPSPKFSWISESRVFQQLRLITSIMDYLKEASEYFGYVAFSYGVI